MSWNQISLRGPSILSVSRWFSSVPAGKLRDSSLPLIWPRPLPSTSITIRYSFIHPIIRHIVWLVTASLNKTLINTNWTNDAVEWLALLLRIRDARRPAILTDFSVVFSVPPRKSLDSRPALNYATIVSFHIRSNSLFVLSFDARLSY
jgi:hypothetical protein